MGGSAANDELLVKLTEVSGISDEVASVVHSDKRQSKLNYNLAWAKSYLKRAGALENSVRGVWSLTEIGETMDKAAALSIPIQVRREDLGKKKLLDPDQSGPADVRFNNDVNDGGGKEQLLSTLKIMDPAAFERLSQRVLRESGFTKVEVTGRSGDGGIDGVGVLRLNLLSFSTLFQCKRYAGSMQTICRHGRGGSRSRLSRCYGGPKRQRLGHNNRNVFRRCPARSNA